MGAMVNCVKMKRELEGLDKPPYPGDLVSVFLRMFLKRAGQNG